MFATEINNYLRDSPVDLFTQERCGFACSQGVVEVENTSDNPQESFKFSQEDTLRCIELVDSGYPVTIWHTHITPGDDDFSYADVCMLKALDIDSEGLFSLYLFNPVDNCQKTLNLKERLEHPYTGREWGWWFNNCYTLVQDFYLKEFNIKLNDYHLTERNAWEKPEWNAYMTNFSNEGFVNLGQDISKVQYGDVLLFKIGKTHNPNHVAIMLEPEKNTILHHLVNRLSEKSDFSIGYRNRMEAILRYGK